VVVRCERVSGSVAEDIALSFLIEKGMILLERNWRWGHKELDLVMKSICAKTGVQILHIIEVRSLTEPCAQMPFESVNHKKRRAIISAAGGFVRVNNINFETRFDIISVTFSSGGIYRLEYFQDAFTPEW
jgi:putative endonuclease